VKPDKLLQIFTPLQKVSGSRFDEMLSRQRNSWGDLSDITPDKMMGKLSQNKMELTIPYITIKGDQSKGISKDNIDQASPPAVLTLEGLAVFKNDRLSYWLSSRESKLFAITHTKISDTTLVTKCLRKSGYVSWKNVESTPDIQIQNQKGKPSFLLKIHLKGKLADLSCHLDPSSVQAIASLEHSAKLDLQQQLNHLIAKTQDKKTDVIGFGDALYRKQPDMWNKVKNKWGSEYSTVPIRTKVTFELLDAGEILSSKK
jgi:spore germination protein KC